MQHGCQLGSAKCARVEQARQLGRHAFAAHPPESPCPPTHSCCTADLALPSPVCCRRWFVSQNYTDYHLVQVRVRWECWACWMFGQSGLLCFGMLRPVTQNSSVGVPPRLLCGMAWGWVPLHPCPHPPQYSTWQRGYLSELVSQIPHPARLFACLPARRRCT